MDILTFLAIIISVYIVCILIESIAKHWINKKYTVDSKDGSLRGATIKDN